MIAREKVRLEVTARNKSEALRLVRKQAAGRVPDLEKAAIVRRVSNLRKVD
jgi:hypothetical protein